MLPHLMSAWTLCSDCPAGQDAFILQVSGSMSLPLEIFPFFPVWVRSSRQVRGVLCGNTQHIYTCLWNFFHLHPPASPFSSSQQIHRTNHMHGPKQMLNKSPFTVSCGSTQLFSITFFFCLRPFHILDTLPAALFSPPPMFIRFLGTLLGHTLNIIFKKTFPDN